MHYILAAVATFIFGIFLGWIFRKKTSKESPVQGYLIVYEDPDDGDYLFLESSIPISEYKKMGDVRFGVKIRTPQDKQLL